MLALLLLLLEMVVVVEAVVVSSHTFMHRLTLKPALMEVRQAAKESEEE